MKIRTDVEIEQEMIEQLAALEHQQWLAWAIPTYQRGGGKVEWMDLFVPYEKLSEDEKEKDRVWARQAAKICMQTARILNDREQSMEEARHMLSKLHEPAGAHKYGG